MIWTSVPDYLMIKDHVFKKPRILLLHVKEKARRMLMISRRSSGSERFSDPVGTEDQTPLRREHQGVALGNTVKRSIFTHDTRG